jgi:DNA mismatch repair protein MutL
MLRSNKQGEIFSVNGRTIRSLLLSRALLDGYHTLIQAKHYPYAILNLQIPPDEYDVNVHPTKLEIRFRKEKEIAEFISANVAASVIKGMKESYFSLSGPYAEYDAGKKDNIVLGGRTYSYRQVINIDKDLGHIYGKKTTVSEESNVSAKEDSAIEYVTETAAILANNSEYIQNTAIATGAILEKDEAFFLDNIWPLAQVLQTYILATDGKELIIIDQHAVHERINYELIWERANNSLKISQELLIPVALELSLQEEQILLEHLSVLLDMGFVIEHFGARDYRLRAVPAYTGSLPAEELLHQFLDNVLNTNQIITLEKMVEKWIYILACHQSMKAKQSLSLLEMEQLIEKLRQTKNPFTCPHGRPTMIRFSKSDLEKKFYRA